MSTPSSDEELMALLAEAEASRALVTPEARAAARGAFAWRTIEEELMELTFDSAHGEEVLVRDTADDVRVIGFQGSFFSLEVERDGDDLVGQVVRTGGTAPQGAGAPCRVDLLTRAGERGSVAVDESGFFTLRLEGDPPWRLRVDVAGRTESTGWLAL